MTELQKEINEAYNALALIPVAGDHVEVMAAAREHLRHAYKLAEQTEKVGKAGGESGGRQDDR